MPHKKMNKIKWLLAITILGALLRFWGLGQNPPGLYWDEVSLGWNAYSILKTGLDEHGRWTWDHSFHLPFRGEAAGISLGRRLDSWDSAGCGELLLFSVSERTGALGTPGIFHKGRLAISGHELNQDVFRTRGQFHRSRPSTPSG